MAATQLEATDVTVFEGFELLGSQNFFLRHIQKRGLASPHEIVSGAAEGNRTLVIGLGSLCSTIELQPHEEVSILQKKTSFSYFL